MPSCPWLVPLVSTALCGMLNGPSAPASGDLSHHHCHPLTFRGPRMTVLSAHYAKLFRERPEGGPASGCAQCGLLTSRVGLTWNLLEMRNLGPTPELANQALGFNKSPMTVMRIKLRSSVLNDLKH